MGFLTGDVIFLDLGSGGLCKAIETVTLEQFGRDGPRLSHVGIVDMDPSAGTTVLEAWPEGPRGCAGGVLRTPLDEVLARVKGGRDAPLGYYVVRVPPAWQSVAARAVLAIRNWIGMPYDHDFVQGNGAYYCAELIYEGFRIACDGRPPFAMLPMYFGQPGTPVRAVWDAYFGGRGRATPVGEPGISPLGIYVHVTGWLECRREGREAEA